MKYMVILMMLVGCSAPNPFITQPYLISVQYVTRPPDEQLHSLSSYFIKVPVTTSAVWVYWYYGDETNSRYIYSSGYLPITGYVVETDMHFPLPGKYILIYYCQTSNGVIKYRQTYNVRLNEL